MFKKKLKLSFFDKIVLRFNLFAALGLLITYFAPYVNPGDIGLVALFGLAYPLAVTVNVLFVLYWLVKRKVHILWSLAAILSGWSLLTNSFALNFSDSNGVPVENAIPLKVMTYNVQNFDLYNWNENIESRDKMMELIKAQEPDVICFQEFYTDEDGDFHNVKFLVNELGFQHYHFVKTLTLKGTHHWGLAIFSKYPMVNKDKVAFSNTKNNIVAVADIDVEGQVVRLFNTHLQSIHLGNKDLKYLEKIGASPKEIVNKENLESSKKIINKLKDAYVKRSAQAQDLAFHIRKSPHPVVVCGDFNDTPASYAYRTIARHLKDAFLEVGLGTGGTYVGPLPSFRIDYVLLDSKMEVKHFEVLPQKYSDHYPVSCTINLPVTDIGMVDN